MDNYTERRLYALLNDIILLRDMSSQLEDRVITPPFLNRLLTIATHATVWKEEIDSSSPKKVKDIRKAITDGVWDIRVGQVWQRKGYDEVVCIISINPIQELVFVSGLADMVDPMMRFHYLEDNFELLRGWIDG